MNEAGPKTFRWRLAGDKLPLMRVAFRVGMATRAAVYRGAERRRMMPLPDNFHKSSDHSHAFWLPEDTDGDGRIDHVLLFAASGIPWQLLPVLVEIMSLRLAELGNWTLLPEAMGESIAAAPFGPAQRWLSVTPYIAPLKGRRRRRDGTTHILTAQEQLRWEIGERRLGARLLNLSFSDTLTRASSEFSADDFVQHARKLKRLPPGNRAPKHWSAPSGAQALAAELIFSSPVYGPLAFGFGAHFGLGLLLPAH